MFGRVEVEGPAAAASCIALRLGTDRPLASPCRVSVRPETSRDSIARESRVLLADCRWPLGGEPTLEVVNGGGGSEYPEGTCRRGRAGVSVVIASDIELPDKSSEAW